MRKDVKIYASIDSDSARMLAAMATRETEGNQSQMIRRAIREAGNRRGLLQANESSAETGEAQSEETDLVSV